MRMRRTRSQSPGRCTGREVAAADMAEVMVATAVAAMVMVESVAMAVGARRVQNRHRRESRAR
eukprot:7279188-Prymnesium_polylepis.1